MKSIILSPVEECVNNGILYSIRGETNASFNLEIKAEIKKVFPPAYMEYSFAFEKIMKNIVLGNSYLSNLTFRSEIETQNSLDDIFISSSAPYKLLFRDKFTVFSPEIFVKIIGKEIKTFPMKGTISSDCTGSLEKLINDEKEQAEHLTVVDLLPNTLSNMKTVRCFPV
ncbi:MAG: chorismate-binding protein [Spirochaetes bacterium]|nr:chorismate-binding protein [Spirochaetota bacterium]